MLSEETMTEEKKTEPVEQPVPTKKPDEELADTVNQFFSSMTAATQQTLKSMLAQFTARADATIAKLNEKTADSAPPKKPDEVAAATPPEKQA